MFTGLNLEEQLQTSYHTIVTDHPYMHEIGLSAFTTGELYNWMIKQNSTGFINLRLIDQVIWKPEDIRKKLKKPEDVKENMLLAARLILGSQDTAPGKPQTKERYYFTSPRTTENPKLPQMRPVEYVKFNNKAWEKWTYTNKNGTTSYVAKDLDFGYFAGKVFETTDYTPLAGNPSVPYQLNWQLPQLGYHLDDRISHIIEMNNYARLLNAIYPESEWNRYSHLASSSAIAEFVRDIKASKEQCIQWEGYVPFVLNFDGINTTSRCVKWEKVKYKLYLYDMATPKDASRKITFTNDFTIVGQHIDAMGRTGAKEDGEVNTPSPQGNPNESIAANLRVYYNPSTRKYESGTAQILGRMVDDLGPAKATDLDKVLKLTVKDLQSPDNQHMVTIGEAIPIINQNANPLLWAPEYGESKNCRSSNDKNKLTVYNVSHKRFKKGETVLLQNIGGAWVPSSLGEPDTGGTGSFTGKWAFTYLMTNADAFFRNISGELLTYNAYEQGVHNMYYSDDEWSATSTKNAASIIDVFNGYYHVTSFDFMGKNICGTRDLTNAGTNKTDAGNSISCTQFSIDPKGDSLENGGKFLNGKTSGPFFGCVFPDGYSTSDDTGEKITTYTFGTPEIKSFQFDWMEKVYGPKALMFSETEASVDTAVFANKNDNKMNTSAANKLGMFYALYSETPTYDLKHLPADIGTNASPVGKNGYPITNLNHVWPAFKPYDWSAYNGVSKKSGPQLTAKEFRDQVTNLLFRLIDANGQTRYGLGENDFTIPGSPDTYYYTRHNWLYLNTVSPTKLIDSAFDLKPAVPNRLQFRPLKTEVFASWEKPTRDLAMMSPTNKYVIKSKGIEAPRGVYGSLCWELLESDSPVISYASLERNNRGWRNWLFWWPQYGEWQDIAYGAPDVHGNVPIAGNPKWDIGPSLRYSNDICYRWQKGTAPSDAYYINDLDNPRHPAYNVGQFFKTGNDVFAKCYIDTDANACIPWWSRYWNIGGKISQREKTNGLALRGAGGIGIIAAQAELKAFKGVTFTTENYLGVRSYYQNKKWMPSWGFQNNYNSQNTISLHAKIMHKWPRGLTIYDPRFFATFHFNPPGAWINDPKPTWYNGTEVIQQPQNPPAAGEEEFPEGIYKVDNITSSVDTRVPTLNNGSIVPYYTYVYADIGLLGEQPCTLRNPEYWNVNYNRRNKLLPYKYKIPTIAIPAVLTDGAASDEAEVLVGSKVASNCKSIVILNGGKNYKPTDTFTTVGGPPSVKHATLLPILNNGSIIGFKYDTKKITRNINGQITTYDDPQCGYGFYPSHFADKDDVIDGNYTFKIKIIPVVANGTGFAGGVIRGIVVLSPVIEDAKPAYATSSEFYEISAKPPSEGNVSAARYDAGGSIESTVIKEVDKIISVTAGITNPSPDNNYDVFLFFHNDISFAMMETWNGVAGVEPVSQENHITVTIDPT